MNLEHAAPCLLCGHSQGNRLHTVRDLNVSGQEDFEYLECAGCGCLQLMDVPDDLERYYPPGYYAYGAVETASYGVLKTWLKRQKYLYFLHGRNLIGRLMEKRAGSPPFFSWLSAAKVGFNSSILDIGCGTGHLLNQLRRYGFSDLTGADPFIERDILYPNGVSVWKKSAEQIERQFDFVMLHHAFEHMPEPVATLRQVWRLLKPQRYALIRIPVASCFAWREYGVRWVQLDAPRHLFLHTPESMKLIAQQAGFELREVFYDSDEFQFVGSESHLRGIPIPDGADFSTFSAQDRADFRSRANELNLSCQGDQAGFYLFKP